jgi:sporadic carbohydrate cluster protein (TIGR04323 family)
MGQRQPHHIQNVVIRDYCRRRDMDYLLSATEYAMPGSFMLLHQTLDELPDLDGIVLYSLFLLPEEEKCRHDICRRVLEAGSSMHFAVEGLEMNDQASSERIEEIWQVALALPHCPNTV